MISETKKDKLALSASGETVENKDRYGLFYDEYKKFAVPDVVTGSLLTIETNWNKYVGKNSVLKLAFKDQTAYVRNSDLREILKLLAPLEEVEKLLQHSKRFYEQRSCIIKFRAQKRYARGDEVWMRVELPVTHHV